MAATRNIVVVGGNGFLGSAICKAFLSAGASSSAARPPVEGASGSSSSASGPSKITVTSLSPSGRPFVSPAGHQPAWSASPNIKWEKADVLDESPSEKQRIGEILSQADAVVHTVGILLESSYKPDNSPSSSRAGSGSGSVAEVAKGVLRGWGISNPLENQNRNPLQQHSYSGKGKAREVDWTYERMNRDSALNVAQLFASSLSSPNADKAFVYISASDIFRPLISSRYIGTKRQAEEGIWQLAASNGEASPLLFRPYFMRPGLMYHPHTRPLSTLPAALFDLSASVHQALASLPLHTLTPASILRSPLLAFIPQDVRESIAKGLTYPPLHVDTVAKAVVNSVLGHSPLGGHADAYELPGAKGVDDIRRLAGWKSFTPVEQPPHPFAARSPEAP